jgi:hypothetical protein
MYRHRLRLAQALTCRELGLSAKAREAPLAPPGAAGRVAAAKARVDIAAQLKRMRD